MHTGVGEVHPDTLPPAARKRDGETQGQTHSHLAQERRDTQTFIPSQPSQNSLLGGLSLSE